MTSTVRIALVMTALLAACGGGDGDGANAPGGARVIEVRALDSLKFDPSAISAKAGEKVTFRVMNAGSLRHEFVIGDAAYQSQHESTASAHAHGGGDGGAAVEVKAGETKTLEYTMPATAPVFACHVDSHDDAGMKGTVTY